MMVKLNTDTNTIDRNTHHTNYDTLDPTKQDSLIKPTMFSSTVRYPKVEDPFMSGVFSAIVMLPISGIATQSLTHAFIDNDTIALIIGGILALIIVFSTLYGVEALYKWKIKNTPSAELNIEPLHQIYVLSDGPPRFGYELINIEASTVDQIALDIHPDALPYYAIIDPVKRDALKNYHRNRVPGRDTLNNIIESIIKIKSREHQISVENAEAALYQQTDAVTDTSIFTALSDAQHTLQEEIVHYERSIERLINQNHHIVKQHTRQSNDPAVARHRALLASDRTESSQQTPPHDPTPHSADTI